MKKIYFLYVLEIIAFLSPFFVFINQDILSKFLIGLIFTIPFNVFILINFKNKQCNIFLKIFNYLVLIGSLISLFIAIIAYDAAHSFNIL